MKNKLFTALSVIFLVLFAGSFLPNAFGAYDGGGDGTGKGKSKKGKVISVKVSPSKKTLNAGESATFKVKVKKRGKVSKKVVWTVKGGTSKGTISAKGNKKAVYTAPSSISKDQTVKIKAVSTANKRKKATAKIALTASTGLPAVTAGDDVDNTITISGFAYSPLNIGVSPGILITVTNKDSAKHSVTSQEEAGLFQKGSVSGIMFDTGEFSSADADRTIMIPVTATIGTVIPYYCTVHKASMATPDGYVTVQ